MIVVEILYIAVLAIFSVITVRSDLKDGMVYNKTILKFGMIAIVLDLLYYSFFGRDLFIAFAVNLLIVSGISIFLFYTHSFAGGDCKLAIVLAMLFPARFYLKYGDSCYTLLFAIGIAVFLGYLYLLGASIYELIRKNNQFTRGYIQGYVISFLKSFVTAMIYINAVNLIALLFGLYNYTVMIWVIRIVCIVTSWMIGKYSLFKKWYMITGIVVADVGLSIWLGVIPISINPENYILVLVLLLCQMTIRTNLYQDIEVENLKKGMILTTASSVLMQGSRVRGLPGVSSEDLRNRLTETEIDSIKRWAVGRNVTSISIVKKIPFAFFMVIGFWLYLAAWGYLR